MATTQDRLTAEAAAGLSTPGPGALNLTTGAAYAQLGAMPMIMITGPEGALSREQARFRSWTSSRPRLTKMAHQIISLAKIPRFVQEAFPTPQQEDRARSISNCRRLSRQSNT
jgi:acetolactate synthase I/II/III large subunit